MNNRALFDPTVSVQYLRRHHLLLLNTMQFVQSPVWGSFYFRTSSNPRVPHLHSAFCQHCTPSRNAIKKKKKENSKQNHSGVHLHVSKATTETTTKNKRKKKRKFRFLSALASTAIRSWKIYLVVKVKGYGRVLFVRIFEQTSLLCSSLPSPPLRLALSISSAIVALPSRFCLSFRKVCMCDRLF